MIILVGAGGFLGYSLSKYFSRRKIKFATVSRSFQWNSMVHEKRCIGSASEVIDFISTFAGDVQVLYMAGSPNLVLAEQDPSSDLYVHESELRLFLQIFSNLKCACKRFVFVSSGGTVYGDSLGVLKMESSDLNPKSAYGKRNVSLEKTVAAWASSFDIRASIFRVTNPFGPGQFRFRRRGLVQALIDSASSGQKISIRGNGYQKRDYLFSDSLCSMVGLLLELDRLPAIINIASGFSYSAREVVEVLSANQIFPVFEYVDSADDFEVKDSLVSASLVRSILRLDDYSLAPFRPANILDMVYFHGEDA